MQNRIEVFKQMLESDPENTMVMFGLAKEYEKVNQTEDVIEILEKYLAKADDEGNAYGMLARLTNKRETAKKRNRPTKKESKFPTRTDILRWRWNIRKRSKWIMRIDINSSFLTRRYFTKIE